MRWCWEHVRWNRARWENVFSDEARLCLLKNDARTLVWCRRSERHMQLVVCSQPGLSMEVASWCGLGSVTQAKHNWSYQWKPECTSPHPYDSYPISCPLNKHRRKCIVPGQCPSPPGTNSWGIHGAVCSPDLNPIEHLWDQIGRAVKRRINQHNTLLDRRRYLQEVWNALPQELIRRLINSMWQRQTCVNVQGGATRYWLPINLFKHKKTTIFDRLFIQPPEHLKDHRNCPFQFASKILHSLPKDPGHTDIISIKIPTPVLRLVIRNIGFSFLEVYIVRTEALNRHIKKNLPKSKLRHKSRSYDMYVVATTYYKNWKDLTVYHVI